MPISFGTNDVAKLLGANHVRINKLVDRFLPRVVGVGQGKTREFALGDLLRLALAYWLFQAGLSTTVIENALDSRLVRRFLSRLGNLARIAFYSERWPFLLVSRTSGEGRRTNVRVSLVDNLGHLERRLGHGSCVVLDIRRRMLDLAEGLRDFAIE